MNNADEGSQSESLTDSTKIKLDEMVQPHFNQCVPLRPLLGAIILTKTEIVKEKRQRQPKATQEKVYLILRFSVCTVIKSHCILFCQSIRWLPKKFKPRR